MAHFVTGVRSSPGTQGTQARKRRMDRFVTGVSSEPGTQGSPSNEEENPAPTEEMTVEGRGGKVYKLDLRGAKRFTLNIN